MKPVFKCDYCNFMGTEEKVRKHEPKCSNNYDRRSCFTCKHKSLKNVRQYQCSCGIEIPEGKIFEFCSQYEREEVPRGNVGDIFGHIFGF